MSNNNQQILPVKELEKMISQIRYGSITLIIQDGVLLQIEKNEKIRLK